MSYKLPDGILGVKKYPEEYHLQSHFVAFLRGEKIIKNKSYYLGRRPFPELFDEQGEQKFTHIAQGRDKNEGFHLKRMGLRSGPLDLLFWFPHIFFIDMKVQKRDFTLPQKNFRSHMNDLGIKTFKAYTVAEARDILISQGLNCAHPEVVEPPLSPEQRQHLYLEMMKPIV